METKIEGKRWSGADWAGEKREIMIIGVGGIGSWLTLSLARIEHNLCIIDGDVVDSTNVEGGQLYKYSDIGRMKVNAVQDICMDMGCCSRMDAIDEYWSEDFGVLPITITALDNMKARRDVFEEWVAQVGRTAAEQDDLSEYLYIDGRLLLENMEILCIQGNNEEQIRKYREEYLFPDEDVPELDCTTKQSTFGAMTIAGLITATLCNWLTNRKLGMEFRNCPFFQRFYLPLLDYKQINIEEHAKETV